MKTKDKKDLHTKTMDELQALIKEKNEAFAKLRLDHAMGKLKDVKSIGKLRLDTAIIKTIMREKELKNG